MCSSHWPQNPSGKTVREADCRCWIPTNLWDQTDSTVFFLKSFFSFVSFLFFFLKLLIQLVESWWPDDFQSSLECLCCTWLGSVDFAFILIFKKKCFFSLYQWNKISWNYGRALWWKCFWGMFLKKILFFHVIVWLIFSMIFINNWLTLPLKQLAIISGANCDFYF